MEHARSITCNLDRFEQKVGRRDMYYDNSQLRDCEEDPDESGIEHPWPLCSFPTVAVATQDGNHKADHE